MNINILTDSARLAIKRMVLLMLAASLSAHGAPQPGASSSSTDAVSFAPTPDADDFYRQPSTIAEAPGTILKSRAIIFRPAGVPLPNPAWQLQYVTRDGKGRLVAAVTTVIKPLLPSAHGRPVLVSFQYAYDSLGAPCTPSHTAAGSRINSNSTLESLEFLPGLQALGWTITIPDYEGSSSAWGAGRLSGQATLDAVRAALNFRPLRLPPRTPVALWGYSGGAYASTWAAALHPEYAPELNVISLASGGTVVDWFDMMQRRDGSAALPGLFAALIGITREYPEALPAPLLTEAGRRAVAVLRDACNSVPTDGSTLPPARMSDYVAAADPYLTPGFQSVGAEVSLLGAASRPTADVYLYHEVHDDVVPVDIADKLAAQWCAQGVPLSFHHDNLGSVAGLINNPTLNVHFVGAVVGAPPVMLYLAGRFSGLPVPVTPPGTIRCN